MDVSDPHILTLKDLCNAIWRLKLGIAFGIMAGILLAYICVQFIIPKYQAQIVIAPVQLESQGLGDAVIKRQRSAFIKDILRQAVPSENTQFDLFEQSLTSLPLAEQLVKDPSLLPKIFYRKWREDKKTWKVHLDFMDKIEQFLV